MELEIHYVRVKLKDNSKPQLGFHYEIKVPKDEIRQRILKFVEDDRTISIEDLKVMVDENYKYPTAACSPGDSIQNHGFNGTVGCYVSNMSESWKGFLTCDHCIRSKRNDITVNCQNNGPQNGQYLHEYGMLDRDNDVCIIKLSDVPDVSNSIACGMEMHQLRSTHPRGDAIQPLTLLCKQGAKTNRTTMFVLGHSTKEKITYKMIDESTGKIKDSFMVKSAILVGKQKIQKSDHPKLFDFGDSGSVAVVCTKKPDNCHVAGILFAKTHDSEEDVIALMHPLKKYFKNKDLKFL